MGGRGRLYIYLSLHRHHQNDPCVKMGSGKSYFNVSLIVTQSARAESTNTGVN